MYTETQSALKKLRLLAGLDKHVLATFLHRGWSSVAGAVLVILIPHWFDKVEQGYYFTFASLLALQVFFELGMSQVVLQLASHEVAHLKINTKGHLDGDAKTLRDLSTLASLTQRWYIAAAVVFFVLVGAGGAWFLNGRNYLPPSNWIGAWSLLVTASSINLVLSGKLVFFEAFGNISGVARLRLVQSIIGMLLMWGALTADAKLWGLPLVPVAAVLCTMYWLSQNDLALKALPTKSWREVLMKWKADVLPLQWRLAVSWVSGYFIFQLFTPVAFAIFGPVEAGKLGLSLAIFGALSTLGLSWVTAIIPTMASCVARRDQTALKKIYSAALTRAIIFTSCSSLVAILAVLLLNKLNIPIADRFVSISVAICIAISALMNCISFSLAAYMRSHKEEPMVLPSVVSAIATALVVGIGSQHSVFAMMASYTLVGVCFGLPWTIQLFMGYYRKAL